MTESVWDINQRMGQLVGRRVSAVSLGNDDWLVFETDHGILAYAVEGDCCSHSYFNDVIGVSRLLGHTVTATETVDLPKVDSTEDELVQAYGVKLATDAGYVDIVYRNNSNGYYGGNICGCSTSAPDSVTLRPIAEDYSG